MLRVKSGCPVDYRLCNQTVTVYHRDGENYTQTVHKQAFLDFKKTQTVDRVGAHEAISFLLVIPGSTQAVFPGDKVLQGVGPTVADRESWADMIPTKVLGLCVVQYVDCKYWAGRMVHTEAGG